MNHIRTWTLAITLLAGCSTEPDNTEETTADATAPGRSTAADFDGEWVWANADQDPLYALTIRGGKIQGVQSLSRSARPIAFERCRCSIDGVDGLQFVEFYSASDANGTRVRHCFTFMETRHRASGCRGDSADGHYFEELLVSDDSPLPRRVMRRGFLKRVSQ
jgi:hypothetical protein